MSPTCNKNEIQKSKFLANNPIHFTVKTLKVKTLFNTEVLYLTKYFCKNEIFLQT